MNAKKLLSMLLSAVLAVTTLAGCGEGTNYSNEAVKAANEAQSTVVFETDSDLAKSLQDALEDYTQTSDIKTAMVADENLKDLLTSGYQLDIFAAQGEDAEAAAQAIAQQYIVNIVSGKQSEGKIAMILHKGNGYYYAAVLTYRTGGGSGSGGSGGSSSGGDNEDNKPVSYSITVKTEGNGSATAPNTVQAGESCSITATPNEHYKVASVTAVDKNGNTVEVTGSDNQYTIEKVNSDITVTVTFEKCAVTGIAVKEKPDRMIYEDGDAFEPDGMVITVTYEDSSTEDITTGYEYETGALTPDNNEVTITYEDQETTLEVTVNEKQYVVSVTKEGEGGDVTPLGDTFVTTGEAFNFTVSLDDEMYKVESITVKGDDNTSSLDASEGEKTITNVQSDVKVVVTFAERKLERLDVTGIKDLYTVGEKIDLSKVTVTAVYEGNVKKELKQSEYEISPTEFNTAGEETVTVTYGGKEWRKNVTVNPNTYTVTVEIEGDGTVELNGISYSKDTTIQVEHGDPLTIEATANPGSEFVSIYDGTNTVENGETLTIAGNVKITVTFERIPTVTGIEIVKGPFTDEYTCYDKLDLSGMQIKVTYDNKSTKTVTITDNEQVDIDHCNQKWSSSIFGEWLGFTSYNELKDVKSWFGGYYGGYWVAKFDITYEDHTDQIVVNVTCGVDKDDTPYCEYCPDWDGMNKIARTRSANAHFTETAG